MPLADRILGFVLAILACYRLSQFVAFDDGPFDLMLKIRELIGVYDYDESGRAKSGFAQLIGCPYCLGIWFALPLALFLQYGSPVLAWLGIAGGQAFLEALASVRESD